VEGGLVQFGCNDYTQAPYGVEIGWAIDGAKVYWITSL
jgi:hypothetical protein